MIDELKKIYGKALMDKKRVLTYLEPLRKKEAIAVEKVQGAEAELKKIRVEIVAIENKNKLADLSRTIATLAPKAVRLINT